MTGNNSTSIDSPKDAKNVIDMQYTTIQSINQAGLQIKIIQMPLLIVLGSLFANKLKRSQSNLIQHALWSESKWDFSQLSQKWKQYSNVHDFPCHEFSLRWKIGTSFHHKKLILSEIMLTKPDNSHAKYNKLKIRHLHLWLQQNCGNFYLCQVNR